MTGSMGRNAYDTDLVTYNLCVPLISVLFPVGPGHGSSMKHAGRGYS